MPIDPINILNMPYNTVSTALHKRGQIQETARISQQVFLPKTDTKLNSIANHKQGSLVLDRMKRSLSLWQRFLFHLHTRACEKTGQREI